MPGNEGRFDQRWPELFAPLTSEQRLGVLNALASNWHEGWTPNGEDVADLIDLERNAIDEDEYDRRSQAKSRRRAAAVAG